MSPSAMPVEVDREQFDRSRLEPVLGQVTRDIFSHLDPSLVLYLEVSPPQVRRHRSYFAVYAQEALKEADPPSEKDVKWFIARRDESFINFKPNQAIVTSVEDVQVYTNSQASIKGDVLTSSNIALLEQGHIMIAHAKCGDPHCKNGHHVAYICPTARAMMAIIAMERTIEPTWFVVSGFDVSMFVKKFPIRIDESSQQSLSILAEIGGCPTSSDWEGLTPDHMYVFSILTYLPTFYVCDTQEALDVVLQSDPPPGTEVKWFIGPTLLPEAVR